MEDIACVIPYTHTNILSSLHKLGSLSEVLYNDDGMLNWIYLNSFTILYFVISCHPVSYFHNFNIITLSIIEYYYNIPIAMHITVDHTFYYYYYYYNYIIGIFVKGKLPSFLVTQVLSLKAEIDATATDNIINQNLQQQNEQQTDLASTPKSGFGR